MAFDARRITEGPLQLRTESGRIVTPEGMAGKIQNFELTEAGTLRSVRGPIQYHPRTWPGGAAIPSGTTGGIFHYGGPFLGTFHCTIEGGTRDILLIHATNDDTGNGGIFEHRGYDHTWRQILGELPAAFYRTTVRSDNRPQFRTQFTATPNGVVITLQGGSRSYFYDGYTLAPLGFEKRPGAPIPHGPRMVQVDDGGGTVFEDSDQGGYYYSGINLLEEMGTCRLGTLRGDATLGATSGKANALGGILEAGMWRAATQWLDKWGNKSPIGNVSSPATVYTTDNLTKLKKHAEDETAERLRVQLAWSDLDGGPRHARFMNLLRTKDLNHSGTAKLFNVPSNAAEDPLSISTFATTAVKAFPDNIPDAWLVAEAEEVEPVPRFHLSELAFGRLWVASEGKVQPSEPFFWGTFRPNQAIFPDASGSTVTGLRAVDRGLMVFTETSTFLITQNEGASASSQFKAETLNRMIGCVSPDTVQSLPDGTVMWLGREGFYKFDGTSVTEASLDIKENVISRVNKGWRVQAVAAVDPRMGEYRCWLPVDGSQTNNLCVVFDGRGWRERTDTSLQSVCVTRDYRQLMLGLGSAPGANDSLWVVDREGVDLNPATRQPSIIETTWLRNATSGRRSSPARVRIWLRETTSGTLAIESMRDWREEPSFQAEGPDIKLYPDDDPPPFWDALDWDEETQDLLREQTEATTQNFIRRRPFWSVVDLHIPSCEVFKLRMTFTGDVEFIGLVHEVNDRDKGGAQLPRGTS